MIFSTIPQFLQELNTEYMQHFDSYRLIEKENRFFILNCQHLQDCLESQPVFVCYIFIQGTPNAQIDARTITIYNILNQC